MTKRLFAVFTLILFAVAHMVGQDTTSTQFESTESTPSEDAAAIAGGVVLIPLAIGSTVISVVPPSGGVLVREGKTSGVLSFETGIGFGEKINLKRFSDARLTFAGTHIFSENQKDYVRLEAKKDIHIAFIDRRELFLFGMSPLAGVFTEFPSTGYSAGASVWLMTPWLSFFGFIPQHTFGITYRYNRYLGGNVSNEISAGISSAFTWGW